MTVLLIAHGSADPRAAAANRALAAAVARRHPDGPVRVAFLDHAGPRPGEVLTELAAAGWPTVTVVPLLLTAAYHGRVDIPRVLDAAAAGAPAGAGGPVPRAGGPVPRVELTDVLGPVGGVVPAMLLAGLRRRLAEAGGWFDAVVLAAAGTRDRAALSTVEHVARSLGTRLGVPCRTAYASASAPTGAEAVAALRAGGARRVAVAGYFIAPGRLYDGVVGSARAGGASVVAAPLGDAPELARLVVNRVAAARPHAMALAA